jgi:hypothetical protein
MAIVRVIPAGDLKLTNGTTETISGPAEIKQRLAARFKFFLGEWFLDTRQGVPYYRDVLVKNPNLTVIRQLFLRITTTTPGVQSVPKFELFYDALKRRLSFAFHAIVEGGTVTVTEKDRDFLVAFEQTIV